MSVSLYLGGEGETAILRIRAITYRRGDDGNESDSESYRAIVKGKEGELEQFCELEQLLRTERKIQKIILYTVNGKRRHGAINAVCREKEG